MQTYQVSPLKMKRLQAEYSRLKREDDPRTFSPAGQCFADDREGRLDWARAHLGAPRLQSFTELSGAQVDYLLDILAGKPTRLDAKLRKLFGEKRIAHPEEWFAAIQAKGQKFIFKGAPLRQLNFWQKRKLVNLIVTHGRPGQRPLSPARVSEEQQLLWGEHETQKPQTRPAVPRGNH